MLLAGDDMNSVWANGTGFDDGTAALGFSGP
jgi:hypothetical protein